MQYIITKQNGASCCWIVVLGTHYKIKNSTTCVWRECLIYMSYISKNIKGVSTNKDETCICLIHRKFTKCWVLGVLGLEHMRCMGFATQSITLDHLWLAGRTHGREVLFNAKSSSCACAQ